MSELARTINLFTPECPLHWWDGDVGCRRPPARRGLFKGFTMSVSRNAMQMPV